MSTQSSLLYLKVKGHPIKKSEYLQLKKQLKAKKPKKVWVSVDSNWHELRCTINIHRMC